MNNSPDDGSSEWVQCNFPHVHILNAPRNLGYAGGNNLGIQYALRHNADVVMLLNPDIVLDAQCLQTIEAAMAGDPGIAQPILSYPDGQLQSAGNMVHYLGFGCSGHSVPCSDDSKVCVSYCSGAALWIDLRVLKSIGLFEEALFFYHEDLELGLRAHLAGFKSWCVPNAKAIHHHCPTGRTGKKFARMEGNRWFVWLAYLGMGGVTVLLPLLLLAETAVVLQSVKHSWFRDKIDAMLRLPCRLHAIRSLRKRLLKITPSPGRNILPLLSDHLDFPQPESFLERCANTLSKLFFPAARRLLQAFYETRDAT